MNATLKRAAVIGIIGFVALSLADAVAARPPSDPERAAITQALPAWFRNYPVGCVWLIIRVSKNGQYAFVAEGVNNPLRAPCAKYAFNGFWVLRQRAGRWKVIFNGCSGLPCSLDVPGDLRVPGGCTRGP
jgi:hypothetical protein